MSVQLFNLRGVPADEAEAIRRLLRDNAIDYYETPPGNWGISIPALWLREATQLDEARALIADYQQQRARDARQRLQDEPLPGLLRHWLHQPLRSAVYLGAILVVLYLSIKPFVRFGA